MDVGQKISPPMERHSGFSAEDIMSDFSDTNVWTEIPSSNVGTCGLIPRRSDR